MEEFSALAARVAASVGDLRGVLILSRDGLVLGAFPDGDEALVKPAWLRFAGLGEPDKGFVEFADELWAYVRRGPYASFAVTGVHVRPGLVMDQLEQMLLTAEEVRSRREALRLPDAAPAPSGKPRTSLHADPRPAPQPVQVAPQEAAPAPPRPAVPPQAPAAPVRPGAQVGGAYAAPQPPAPQPPARPPAPIPDVSGPPSAPSPAPGPDGGPERSAPPELERPFVAPERPLEDEGEVDPVLLAQEFSRLLQETGDGDET
ncbi:MAG: hypothetical protein ACXVQJ_10700 [Actinomycetota bacterium]